MDAKTSIQALSLAPRTLMLLHFENMQSLICTHAMALLCQSSDPVTHLSIAKAVITLDKGAEEKLKEKFNIAYFLCKEYLAFAKMQAVCQLQEAHGFDLSIGYKNEFTHATLGHYIGLSLKEQLADELQHAKFFSIQQVAAVK